MSVSISLFAGAGWQFFDNNGVPLSGGLLYTYSAGTTTPQTTYTTSVGNIANANPIVLDSSGRIPNEIWLTNNVSYKFVLKTSVGVQIGSYDNIQGGNDPTALNAFIAQIAASSGSSLVGFIQSGTGAVAETVQTKLRDSVSVTDFGADATGIANSTTAFNNAIATGKAVYVPKGTYLVNATISNKTIIYGDGSSATTLKPYNTAIAAMTYSVQVGDWYYHSEIRNIGFRGTSKTGVGFTFGQTVPSSYVTNDQFCHNVKFYGCYFADLQKGVQFPFGNIGTEFYSCGWGGNYYGVYTMDNKFGSTMHAGNKYFYSGYFGSNDVAFYYNNTPDGSGGVSFYSVIFEGNKIAAYVYALAHPYAPIVFNDTWFETNGTYQGGSTNVDVWSGTTVTPTSFTNRTVIVDGNNACLNFNGGFLTDFNVVATNSRLTLTNARVENSLGVNGGPFTVAASSMIQTINTYTSNGFTTDGLVATEVFSPGNFLMNSTAATSRATIVIPRNSKISSYGPSRVASEPFTSAKTTSGALALVGSIVSDGVIYSTCNEWTRAAMTTAEAVYVSTTSVATVSGSWYVATVDVKKTAGAPTFTIDDQSNNILAYLTIPTSNKWYTIAAMGQANSTTTISLWTTGSNATCTWRHSAFQIHKFSSQLEAQNFLMSCAYAES
jgi:hypothetical protein